MTNRRWSIRLGAVVIEFGVLGPLTVHREKGPVVLGAPMLRRLLAVLLCQGGQPVAVEALVEALWSGSPPRTVRKTLRVYVRRLRLALVDERRIIHGPGGYLVIAEPEELDATRFRTLMEQGQTARRNGDLPHAHALLEQALALWRGVPYADVDGSYLVADEVRRLEEQRLTAQEERVALALDLRRHAEVVGDLVNLSAAHPYQQRLAVYLMLALYRCGRQVEALGVYRQTRTQLVDELGIEPGPVLGWLHGAILRNDQRLGRLTTTDLDEPAALETIAAPPAAAESNVPVVPRQLPAGVSTFTGRSAELAQLDALIPRDDNGTPTALVISVVSGTAGVGKTALAVHWAHRVADRFPDGHLYIDLRGFDLSGQPVTPAQAIRGFLDALGVPPVRVPVDLATQVGLYRSLLANRRLLVVLDNARDAEQVRPLLPGSSSCVAVVTSRNQLTGLIAQEGAHPLTLGLLTDSAARDLLGARLGTDRVTAERDSTQRIIARCAGLPLALAMAAARAATSTASSLAALARQLHDTRATLDTLASSDPVTDMRAVFSWSYQALSPAAAQLFRHLGLSPGPDISLPATASLTGLPQQHLRPLLTELTDAHLLTEHLPGRYALHDLIRGYATELAETQDTNTDRHAARHRILDHYLYTAHTAAMHIDRHREPLALPPAQAGVIAETIIDHQHGWAWFDAERAVLVAAVHYAAATRFDRHAWQLAWSIADLIGQRAYWHDSEATHQTALRAARRLADPLAQAQTQRSLGRAYAKIARYQDSEGHLRHALTLFGQLGDHNGQAVTHQNLAVVLGRRGNHEEALGHAQQALELFQATGHRMGEAIALNNVGWHHAALGRHDETLALCQRALELFHETGSDEWAGNVWDSIGYAYHQLGRFDEAKTRYEHALTLLRRTGGRYGEAITLDKLGDVHHAAGNLDAAHSAWRAAIEILDELDHPVADQIRAKPESVDRWASRVATVDERRSC